MASDRRPGGATALSSNGRSDGGRNKMSTRPWRHRRRSAKVHRRQPISRAVRYRSHRLCRNRRRRRRLLRPRSEEGTSRRELQTTLQVLPAPPVQGRDRQCVPSPARAAPFGRPQRPRRLHRYLPVPHHRDLQAPGLAPPAFPDWRCDMKRRLPRSPTTALSPSWPKPRIVRPKDKPHDRPAEFHGGMSSNVIVPSSSTRSA